MVRRAPALLLVVSVLGHSALLSGAFRRDARASGPNPQRPGTLGLDAAASGPNPQRPGTLGLARGGRASVAGVPAGSGVPLARSFGDAVAAPARAAGTRAWARQARARLVAQARADLRAGTLGLGDFLLKASALDAAELGQPLDLDAARALYRERVDELAEALGREDAAQAVPEVFADLRYFGRPGGLMADALLDRGGSCEQLSHLVAAAAFDAAEALARDAADRAATDATGPGAAAARRRPPAEVALRFYGGAMDDGASHLTPVVTGPKGELDLLAGRPAVPGGVRFPASSLVEAYARAHGLAPALRAAGPGSPATPSSGGGPAIAGVGAEPERPSLSAGYPQNLDRFPGSIPLYATRGVAAASDADELSWANGRETSPVERASAQARSCSYFVRMAVLDPPSVELAPEPAGSGEAPPGRVELRRAAGPSELERKAGLLRGAQDLASSPLSDAADRLMALACLAGLGGEMAVDFTLAGERALARAAQERAAFAAAAGASAVASALAPGEAGAAIRAVLAERFAGETWLLLVLPGGGALVTELVRAAARDDWGQVYALAAMVVDRHTREAAFARLAELPRAEQVDVMHEVFRAHDNLRPWASNYSLDPFTPAAQVAVAPVASGTSVAPLAPLAAVPPVAPAGPAAGGGEFPRAYRVFRGLAWRLWEGQRPPAEALDALSREARAAGLSAEWEALLLAYYVRNLVLDRSLGRLDGLALVRELERAVRANGHPSLAPLARRLAEVEASGRLDPGTLSSAWRLR